MKRISLIMLLTSFCIFGFNSCVDLDLEPKGQASEAQYFGSEEGIETYFAGMYGWLPIEDFLYNAKEGYMYPYDDPWGTWEAQKNMQQNKSSEFIGQNHDVANDGAEYWRYDRIRDLNSFINNFEKYEGNFTTVRYNELLGEARFLRAFIFWGMVKRYGGIPIITEVQDPADDPEILAVSRDTEYDCYKFMYEDLKFAGENMSKEANSYRGNKWTALALQSRIMLNAATIAKYTQYLEYAGEAAYDQGFAGMSPSVANEFFQYAYDAAKELIDDGPYSLYNVKSDLADNFHDMLLDEKSSETIFFKNYIHHDQIDRKAFLIGHNWDALMLPNPSMSNFVGSQAYPSLSTMQRYEGFSIVAEDGTPKRFDNPADIREGMEPRMRGSMYFSGDSWNGVTFQIRRGIYRTFPWQADVVINGTVGEAPHNEGENRILSNSYTERQSVPAAQATQLKNINVIQSGNNYFILKIGQHGMRTDAGAENNNLSGAFVRKYIDETREPGKIVEHSSFQPWVVFRLGEVYLNFAEAAYELGRKDEANTYIRLIRERAGCKNLDISTNLEDVNQWDYEKTTEAYNHIPFDVGLQFIRDERYRELWGENHLWWDLRRWRIVDKVLEQYRPRILGCYYVLDEDKYIYLDEQEMANRNWTANRNAYYQGIPAGEINKNPNLLPQNPFR